MKHSWANRLIALVTSLPLVVSVAQAVPAAPDASVASAREFIAHYRRVARGRDLEATADCFADDAALFGPGEEAIRGRDAVRAAYAQFFLDYDPVSVSFVDEVTYASGDVAVHQGQSIYIERSRRSGDLETFRARWLFVLTRSTGGPWRIRTYAWHDLKVNPEQLPQADARPTSDRPH